MRVPGGEEDILTLGIGWETFRNILGERDGQLMIGIFSQIRDIATAPFRFGEMQPWTFSLASVLCHTEKKYARMKQTLVHQDALCKIGVCSRETTVSSLFVFSRIRYHGRSLLKRI